MFPIRFHYEFPQIVPIHSLLSSHIYSKPSPHPPHPQTDIRADMQQWSRNTRPLANNRTLSGELICGGEFLGQILAHLFTSGAETMPLHGNDAICGYLPAHPMGFRPSRQTVRAGAGQIARRRTRARKSSGQRRCAESSRGISPATRQVVRASL